MKMPELHLVDRLLTAEAVNKLDTQGRVVYWHGFVYINGWQANRASIEEFVNRLNTRSIEEAVLDLKGSFFCIVRHADGTYDAFVDNSGMYTAYACDTGVSRSFLTLVDKMRLGIEDINWTSVAEYTQTNNLYFRRTFFNAINKIGYDQILRFPLNGEKCLKLIKNAPKLTDKPSEDSVQDTFNELATALKGLHVSVDVTGGLDTRMLIAGLHSANVEFETALSGSDEHADVRIAKLVANAISRECLVTPHDISYLEQDLDSTLESLDGLKSHLLTHHRICQLQKARDGRGVQVCLRGVGGEQFRDFKWAQDFPFYLSKKTRFSRFDRMRVEVVRIPDALFTKTFQSQLHSARKQRLSNYQSYLCKYNTQSYDMIDCYETLQNSHSRAMSISATADMSAYCPLSEVHRLQHAYHCERRYRFGALLQKGFITKSCKSLARVRTTYGATASNEPLYLISGSVVLAWTNVKKLIRKLSQTYLGKSPFILVTPTMAGSTDVLRESAVFTRSVNALKHHGILMDTIEDESISDRFIERLLCLGWFLNRLDSANSDQSKSDGSPADS